MKLKIQLLVCLLMLLFFNINKAQNSSSDVKWQRYISNQLITPVRMALDSEDNLYVTDNKQSEILKYDASGNFITRINLDFFPVSVAVNGKDELFVGDRRSGQIFKQTPNGEFSLFYSACEFPVSMEFSADELLYIVDSKLGEVIVLDALGKLVKTIGNGTLIYPTAIACDEKNGRILVGEHGGLGSGFTPPCKVWVFDLSGNLITYFGSYGSSDGKFYRITDVTIGKCGNIYVCDSYQGSISVFDENFTFLTKFGSYGNNPGELNVPLDVVFDSQENILINSMNNGFIEVFNVTDTLPSSNIISSNSILCPGGQKDIKISFKGTPPWNFTYTVDGLNPVALTAYESPYTLSVSEPGIYEIVNLSDANFSGTCFSGSAVISKYDLQPSIDISTATPEICIEDTAKITLNFSGTPPWSFSYALNSVQEPVITTTDNPYVLNVQEEGQYRISSFSDNYCQADAVGSVDISVFENPAPDFDYVTNGLRTNFFNLSLNSENYLWDFGDGTTSTEKDPTHEFKTTGSFLVNLTSQNPVCGERSFSKMVDVTVSSINGFESSDYLTVYPNPSNGKFNLEINNAEKQDVTIEIISLSGKIIYSDFIRSIHTVKEIDLGNIPKGIYTIKLKSDKFTDAVKLILCN